MNTQQISTLLQDLYDQKVSPDEVKKQLVNGPYHTEILDEATLDHHRAIRLNSSEVVFGQSKSKEQLQPICTALAKKGLPVLVTRLSKSKQQFLKKLFPSCHINESARTVTINPNKVDEFSADTPHILIFAAGTSDLYVAEEAKETCSALNVPAKCINDVGVAGLHRLLTHLDAIQKASAIVVVAGMEGALPSVIGGVAKCPIFAVPTSVGYGTAMGGIAAILGMLNSCAPGVAVFNIDNGFSAGYAACKVVHLLREKIKE